MAQAGSDLLGVQFQRPFVLLQGFGIAIQFGESARALSVIESLLWLVAQGVCAGILRKRPALRARAGTLSRSTRARSLQTESQYRSPGGVRTGAGTGPQAGRCPPGPWRHALAFESRCGRN